MKRKILNEAVKLNIEYRHRKRWHRVVSMLAALVVFITTYALILPAITMEQETICGLEEHAHADACYYVPVVSVEQVFQCPLELHTHSVDCYAPDGTEICGYADFAVHRHDSFCYDADGIPVCALMEYREHIHSEECYEEHMIYSCGSTEDGEGHLHSEECYASSEQVCGLEQSEGHLHSELCYGETPLLCTLQEEPGHIHSESCCGEPPLLCGLEEGPEHTHTESCCGEPPMLCGLEESLGHFHNESCYGEKLLICMLQEQPAHVHDESCCGEKQLICDLQEQTGHVHDETCSVVVNRELICHLEEIILHTHTEGCFDYTGAWVCGQRQVLAHQHDSGCFTGHTHTQTCYSENETESVLVCGHHVHDSSCFNEQGQQICSRPVLICGMAEHFHDESCRPQPDDGLVDVTFCIPEEYLEYVQSDVAFPVTFAVKEGAALAEIEGMPLVTVVNPDPDAPEYLPEYHWVAPNGFPIEENTPFTEDVTLTLKLYHADQPETAQLVTATFMYGNDVLLTCSVNYGTVVSELISPELMRVLDDLQIKHRQFDRWVYSDENVSEATVEAGVTVIEQDTVYTAVFREYVPVTLHDIGPDGTEYAGSPVEVLVPSGSSLWEQQELMLSDGTFFASCLWYTAYGEPFNLSTGITQPTELYTYSYVLKLNMTPAEPEFEPEFELELELEPEPEPEPEFEPAEPMLMMLSLEAPTEPAMELLSSTLVQEEMAQAEDETISIIKRSGSVLTESDFVVDGINYTNYQWVDEYGREVNADDLVGTSLASNYALTRAASTSYTISYNINVTPSSVFGPVPNVGGELTLSDTFDSNDGTYTIRIPNPTSFMTTNGNKKTLYQFAGWKISRNNRIVDAGEVVDAAWAESNVNRRTTTVTLTAQWTSIAVTETAHFFVNMNCQVTDVEGNTGIPSSGDFTPSVFSTTISVTGASMKNYWNGAINRDSYSTQYVVFRADTPQQTEAVDTEIRRMISGHDSTYDTYNGASVWKLGYAGTKVFQVEDFPSDEHVLSVVRDMVRNGTVIRMNGVALSADELISDNFTVRWSVCKYDTGDGWHIDGVLVGKQGYLTVKKTFLGDATAVQMVKNNGFTITVDNMTNPSAGDITLTLNPANAEAGSGRTGYSSYDAAADTYTWTLPLEQNNRYAIIENDYISMYEAIQTSASYTVSNSPDAFAGWVAYPEGGISGITAYAYVNDVSVNGYQTVSLRNSYVKADTLTIHKIDRDTGNGLSGVSYLLSDANGNGLTLYRKPDASYYSMKAEDMENGFVRCADSIITTDSNGAIFLKLDSGTFTLEEAFPTGYGGASNISVTVSADSSGNIIFDEVRSSDSTIEVDGALVDAHTATLMIRNVSYSASVTAQKIWDDSGEAQPVTMALYRNGVAMDGEYQVILNQKNNWTYTWNDLPLYADGVAADYSLREIRIGDINYDPTADADGYSGYIVTYDKLVYYKNGEQVSGPVWVDENGVTQYADNARLTVRNDVYRGQMVFMKVDGNGAPLPGATFRLYADAEQTLILAEAVSDEHGRVIFENLMPDTYYVVKESDTPEGYLGADALYKVRLSAQGTTTVEDTSTGKALTAIVNYADEAEVALYKVNEMENPLSGAQFLLEQQTDEGWTSLGTYETDRTGRISLGVLSAGGYRLVETHSPNGYIPLDTPITFTVRDAEVMTEAQDPLWGVSKDTATGVYTITVINETGYELPKTGGPTDRMYIYGGLLLIISAVILLRYEKKRRREGSAP